MDDNTKKILELAKEIRDYCDGKQACIDCDFADYEKGVCILGCPCDYNLEKVKGS